MATWIVGDIHGCADELARLLAQLELGAADHLVAVGDLVHRGPDPLGVIALLGEAGASFVLGNHEYVLLKRLGLAPERPDGADRPPCRVAERELTPALLAGDSGRPLHVEPARAIEVLAFLQQHSGYVLSRAAIPGAGPTRDGREWTVVHAGITPGRTPLESSVRDLLYPARVGDRGPFWFERYAGPELLVFGHLVRDEPIVLTARGLTARGARVALGIDTGCMYGGALTAYSPELDELRSVRAARAYVTRR